MTGYLITALGGCIALIVTFLTGRLSGASAERNANRAKEADAYEQHLEDIAAAADARSRVRPGSVPDPYDRDQR